MSSHAAATAVDDVLRRGRRHPYPSRRARKAVTTDADRSAAQPIRDWTDTLQMRVLLPVANRRTQCPAALPAPGGTPVVDRPPARGGEAGKFGVPKLMEVDGAHHCPSCGHGTRPDRYFSTECGSRFGPTCLACGAAGKLGEKFWSWRRSPSVASGAGSGAPARPGTAASSRSAVPQRDLREATALLEELR